MLRRHRGHRLADHDEGSTMTKRWRSIVTAAAVIAALATGGAVFAQAQNSGSTPPANQPAAQPQEAPASEQGAPENSAADPDNVQDENGKDDAAEKAGTNEKAESPETPGETGSEAPNDDGPGGHADEPGNPNADHQFQGKE
jgi:hypothetical protein